MSIRGVVPRFTAGLAAGLALVAGGARADTTINTGDTFTIDNNNTTLSGATRTWNDSGTLTMFNGATLQTWPSQINTVANNDAIVLAGAGGTIALKFNDNDTDFMLNGSIVSSATGAQTLALYTGYNGNGDRESVTFNSGVPNAVNANPVSLNVTFRTQTGSQSWVNLNAVNTFTGPITLVAGSGPATGYLTIGGTLTRYNGNSLGSGTLNSGNYAGAIGLGAATILNYASSSLQTLSGVISGAGALQVTGSGALTLSGANTYSGNTTVNSGVTLILGSSGGLKFVVTDVSNNKITGGGTANLNGSFNIDTSAVTGISGSWTLIGVTTRSFGGTFRVAGFTGPVGNLFTKAFGGQSWTFNKTTGGLSLSSSAIITSFGVPGSAGTINQVAKTIVLTLPYGTGLASVAPTFALTSGSCNQASGSPPSPTFAVTNPVHYVVTDGSVTNDYAVTVAITPASTNKDILTFGLPGNGGVINGTNITLTVPAIPGVSNLAPTYTVSLHATGAPTSGTSLDFSSPQTYAVTAQDGSTKRYRVSAQTYQAWSNSASFYILTDDAGANLPSSASETNFPVVLRLNRTFFNFGQAKANGDDIRFSTASGGSIPYQIEQWDAVSGTAAIWLNVPAIVGNTRQELKMYWSKPDAGSESSGTAVFKSANGYLSVFHMNETVKDEVGTLTASDTGTTVATGMIGTARNFAKGKGINCGESITNYPKGSSPSTTEAWFRATAANADIVCWGVEGQNNKVRMMLLSPPHIYVDADGPSVNCASTLALSQWYHVAHTYAGSSEKVYVNGQLDGSGGSQMTFANPTKMWIGGWYNNYNFTGDIDEVRVSHVARSTNWIKLEYQNQSPLQRLVGPLVQPGNTFSVAPMVLTMSEGAVTNLVGQAGGAQKLYWIYKENGQETVIAVDQFTLSFAAGRVLGDQSFVLQFRAIGPGVVQTNDIPVTILEAIPEPVFTWVPSTNLWDGRQTMTVTPAISNWSALQAAGVTNLNYTWTVAGVAVTKQVRAGVLTLLRSHGTGAMTVTLAISNGGPAITNTATVTVREPAFDAWVRRTPATNEIPANGQFYARDDAGFGTICYNGTLSQTATNIFLKVYTNGPTGDALYTNASQTLPGNKVYALSARIAPGLVKYGVRFGYVNNGVAVTNNTVTNLVCGDAYIIDGQSNAVADNNDPPYGSYTSDWIRSFGTMNGGTNGGWCKAVASSAVGGPGRIGYWGMVLASNLVATYGIPICSINDSVGGTRIDQHQANPTNHYSAGDGTYSIYASILNRVAAANLTHGIRGVLWHQGENNSGAAAPTGDYDCKSYQQYFVDMSASWKQDYPNIQHYYIYQVWPLPCSMGPKGDQLREAQRTLPRLYSNMSIMSTIGISEPWGTRGLCHFDGIGYTQVANLVAPLIKQDNYGLVPSQPITAPDLKRAYYTTANRTAIALEFGQPVAWNSASTAVLFLDKVPGKVGSGSASGNVIQLRLTAASTAQTIDYLEDASWDGNSASLIRGSNGVAALTFADVPIAPPPVCKLTNLPATGLTTTGALLNASLTCTGTLYSVAAYWSTVNCGTNAGAWTNSASLGVWGDSVSTNLAYPATGLAPNQTYYFTFRATNAVYDVWASSAQSFTTLALTPTPLLPGSSITITGDVPGFTFATVAGFKYRLVYKNTLAAASWLPVIATPGFALPDGWSAPSTGPPMSLSDTNLSGQPQRFYRLEVAIP
jgi:autotransporter-associated beta strand protein